MKPLTFAEVRAWIATLNAEQRPAANHACASMYDEGISAGLLGSARATNPFLPSAAAPTKTKGKAR